MGINKEEARELLDSFLCVEDWQIKIGKDGNVYCIDMTIKNNGWIRFFNPNSCNGNINANENIQITPFDATNVKNNLKLFEQDYYCKIFFKMLSENNKNIKKVIVMFLYVLLKKMIFNFFNTLL